MYKYPVPLPHKVINFGSLATHSPKVTCTHWEENKKPEAVEFELDMPAGVEGREGSIEQGMAVSFPAQRRTHCKHI